MTHAEAFDRVNIAGIQGPAHGNFARVKELLDADPSLIDAMNALDSSQMDETPQGAAAHTGSREILNLFLERGVRMDVFMAAALGRIDQAVELIRQNPARATAIGSHGIPLISHAADPATAKALIDAGVPCDIFMAAKMSFDDHVARLLSQDPSLANAVSAKGVSVLRTAMMFGRKPIVKLLLDHGAADPDGRARQFLDAQSLTNDCRTGMLFDNMNLGNAVFHNVNLANAMFNDINLSGAIISNVTLANASIDFSCIDGLKIWGVEIKPLIEAELKKRKG